MKENSQTSSHFAPYLKHRGRTVEEQIKLNQPALEWLKQCLEEETTSAEEEARAEHWENFKKIVDSFRPQGHKLYSKS